MQRQARASFSASAVSRTDGNESAKSARYRPGTSKWSMAMCKAWKIAAWVGARTRGRVAPKVMTGISRHTSS